VAHENNALWHERDISHSSAERLVLPDNLGLTFYSLRRLTSTIENLVINTDHIQKKVMDSFNYLSSFVLHKLIEENDQTREDLYQLVQEASFEGKTIEQFKEILERSPLTKESDLSVLSSLNDTNLRNIYLKHIDAVYTRVKTQYQIPGSQPSA
jgi:adenylosuccinate lyase